MTAVIKLLSEFGDCDIETPRDERGVVVSKQPLGTYFVLITKVELCLVVGRSILSAGRPDQRETFWCVKPPTNQRLGLSKTSISSRILESSLINSGILPATFFVPCCVLYLSRMNGLVISSPHRWKAEAGATRQSEGKPPFQSCLPTRRTHWYRIERLSKPLGEGELMGRPSESRPVVFLTSGSISSIRQLSWRCAAIFCPEHYFVLYHKGYHHSLTADVLADVPVRTHPSRVLL